MKKIYKETMIMDTPQGSKMLSGGKFCIIQIEKGANEKWYIVEVCLEEEKENLTLIQYNEEEKKG